MRWSVVIPYYNEAAGIAETLHSLASQTRRDFTLILVDNDSTDGSEAVCRRILARYPDVPVRYLREPTPGQVHALKRGIEAADTELIAICDADTFYPPHYLESATRLYDQGGPGLVAVMAHLMPAGRWGFRAWATRAHWLTAARIWPRQNHTSGAGQTFRTAALKAAGGYDPAIWPYVLKDHELLNRVIKRGRQAYHRELWCISSDRRTSRTGVRWTLPERLLYHLLPHALKDWFFYRFLARRFARRGLRDTKLRERAWESAAQAA